MSPHLTENKVRRFSDNVRSCEPWAASTAVTNDGMPGEIDTHYEGSSVYPLIFFFSHLVASMPFYFLSLFSYFLCSHIFLFSPTNRPCWASAGPSSSFQATYG